MGFMLGDPFTHISSFALKKMSAESKTFNTEGIDYSPCNGAENNGYFPKNPDGNCPDNSYTMVGNSLCNCLCNSSYVPIEVIVEDGNGNEYTIIECQDEANVGCMSQYNENYNPTATTHRPSDCGDCLDGYIINPLTGFCDTPENIEIRGCMDPNANYYNSDAEIPEGVCGPCNNGYTHIEVTSETVDEPNWCVPAIVGCMDQYNVNFDDTATTNRESDCGDCLSGFRYDVAVKKCVATGDEVPECSTNQDCAEGEICESGTCIEKIEGCLDSNSSEYDSSANVEDGTCISCKTGYEKDATGLCSTCVEGYSKNAAGICYEDEEESDFPWLAVAGLGIALVLVIS